MTDIVLPELPQLPELPSFFLQGAPGLPDGFDGNLLNMEIKPLDESILQVDWGACSRKSVKSARSNAGLSDFTSSSSFSNPWNDKEKEVPEIKDNESTMSYEEFSVEVVPEKPINEFEEKESDKASISSKLSKKSSVPSEQVAGAEKEGSSISSKKSKSVSSM